MSWLLQPTGHILESIKTEVIVHQVYKIKMSRFVPLLTHFFQRDIFGAEQSGTLPLPPCWNPCWKLAIDVSYQETLGVRQVSVYSGLPRSSQCASANLFWYTYVLEDKLCGDLWIWRCFFCNSLAASTIKIRNRTHPEHKKMLTWSKNGIKFISNQNTVLAYGIWLTSIWLRILW